MVNIDSFLRRKTKILTNNQKRKQKSQTNLDHKSLKISNLINSHKFQKFTKLKFVFLFSFILHLFLNPAFVTITATSSFFEHRHYHHTL